MKECDVTYIFHYLLLWCCMVDKTCKYQIVHCMYSTVCCCLVMKQVWM